MTPLTLRLSQKTPEKNYVFEQIIKHSLNFEILRPLISGLNPKFDYATLCALNRSLVSQNLVLKSYLHKKLYYNIPIISPPMKHAKHCFDLIYVAKKY